MSRGNEDTTEGGQNGPSESGMTDIDAISQIASHLGKIAATRDDKLTPRAQIQISAREPENREKIIEQLVLEMCQRGVNFDALEAWHKGGVSPFVTAPDAKLKKAGHGSEGPTQTLTRSSDRVVAQEKRVETAKAKLEQAERQLLYLKSFESAAVEWLVIDKLIEVMMPALAMGPAWTIMRALTSYVSDDAADKATYMFFGEDKLDAIVDYRKIRVRDTREMFEALDLFAGVPDFEEAVRAAVLKVCKDFEPRREEALADGRRPRSERAMKSSPHPKAQHDFEEVLEGLPTA